ncbi:MAG TPA: pyrroline-5-carboxylate reductase [Candidatus Avipropionibacterium avicola]|uniref:Pyrroline-5-carboxylate reductase n=1 Tax=Candidatus Avipropionibacterium avicola TaxID=2840701 RepID=A0A9D1KM45_9ACTN|nr:pyrroline-5-carboxylate reductase [Candidatus Avipropionibacterium avicola]
MSPDTTSATPSLALLGAGVMGETILSGLIASGWPTDRLTATDTRPERRDELTERYGITMADNRSAAAAARVVVLVVKPQQIVDVLDEIAPVLAQGTVVISIAAGVPIELIESRLPDHAAVIRVMPNTPAQVGRGMSVISGGARATAADLELAETVMRATGEVLTLPESHQDSITAISGSGPAYIFYVVEAMIEAGVHLGVPRDVATTLTVETLYGSASLLKSTGEHPSILRERVTSPGGTTSAALRTLDDHHVRAAFIAAMDACRNRSVELAESVREQYR